MQCSKQTKKYFANASVVDSGRTLRQDRHHWTNQPNLALSVIQSMQERLSLTKSMKLVTLRIVIKSLCSFNILSIY